MPMGSYTGYDAWGLLRFVGGMLLFLAVIVGAVLLIARRYRRRGEDTTTLAVDATLTLCGVAVGLFLISMPFTIVQTMTAATVSIDDFPFQTTLFDNRFPCEIESAAKTHPGIDCFGVSSAWATVSGLTVGVRALIATDQLLWALLAVLPAVALGVICFQLLRGIPFARTVTRTLTVSAVAVLVLGVAAPMLDGISKGAASAAALPSGESGAAFTEGGFSVTVPAWPIGAALALLALAAVFRYGAKLQRDTELLV
ncbi:hypothetical protein [Microbacterium mangrovi]|uniref:hypothetical protein n=1 Tax=Microbacterium mangrovi TaxID=1348253 RepID=UPI00068AF2A7|nr:hypothetical protein [Microbacterium mangrovi]